MQMSLKGIADFEKLGGYELLKVFSVHLILLERGHADNDGLWFGWEHFVLRDSVFTHSAFQTILLGLECSKFSLLVHFAQNHVSC